MQSGLVRASTLGVGPTERQVDGAGDLLVEEDVADEAVEVSVHADAELPDPSRSDVAGQSFMEHAFTAGGGGANHFAVPKFEPDPLDDLPGVRSRKLEGDEALSTLVDRGRIDLAVRDVDMSIADDVGSPRRGEGEMGVAAGDADLLGRLEKLANPIVAVSLCRPVSQRCLEEEPHRLFQTHRRLLGEGLVRDSYQDPSGLLVAQC